MGNILRCGSCGSPDIHQNECVHCGGRLVGGGENVSKNCLPAENSGGDKASDCDYSSSAPLYQIRLLVGIVGVVGLMIWGVEFFTVMRQVQSDAERMPWELPSVFDFPNRLILGAGTIFMVIWGFWLALLQPRK